MAAEKILLVEDDERLARQVLATLVEAGFAPEWIANGSAAQAAAPAQYRLIVLDLMLPGTYGLDVLKHLRAQSDVPVLVLSAKADTALKVRALELGADDYLTKPFWPEELVARVQARLRRPTAQRDGRLELGPLVLDLEGRRVFLRGAPVELTRVEFALLHALARRPGAAVQRAWLVEHVLDPEREGGERTLDVHISRLRKKLAPLSSAITMFVENALLLTGAMLVAVLLAAGPIVARVRRLSREVRASAAKDYALPVAVLGRDEVGELAAAFNAAGAEVHTHVAALETRERALRDFVANTTHDVLLPLTVLQGHLITLRKRLEAQPGELAVVRDALEEAHYLTSLAQNLAAAARLESGVVELQRRPLVLDELLERVLARHRPIAAQKEITLEHALPGEPLTVEADVTLLEQALSNVLHNAERYGRPGGRVLVSLEERGPAGFSVRIFDDGPGIPPKELARLDERSFRSDAARSRHPDGLGLGLSIAREIARRHGFALELRRSEPGGLEVELAGRRKESG